MVRMDEPAQAPAQAGLEELRRRIDEVDDGILDLFVRRMEIARDIAGIKRQSGRRVLDASRERAILADVEAKSPADIGGYATVLFSMLMEMSRSYQEQSLNGESPLRAAVEKALASAPPIFPASATVAVAGSEGAYAQLACDRVFKHPDIRYFSSFEGVFDAVEDGTCPFGVVPLENSTAGSVNRVYDLMMQHDFHIVRTVRVKVDHCLLARPGTRMEDVRVVYSHPQAIAQCSLFLEAHPGVRVVPAENTATAARRVAEDGEPGAAAIASRGCAELYGLDILGSAVQNEGANFTRFACIARDLQIYPGADRASLSLVTPHRPGALCRVLSRFYALDVNVRKLESRPLAGRDFEFMFYFDIEIPAADPHFADVLVAIEALTEEFRYLGSYSEVN